jgi:hypothetical protein
MKIKLIYIIILLLFITAAIIIGLSLNFYLSDAVSFYLGISALTIAIISLSIADKKIDKINYFIKAWWETKNGNWHNVKFKIINNSKTNIKNINLLIAIPKSTAKFPHLDKDPFEQILVDNARIHQTDILKFFPTQHFNYIFTIELELPHWKEEENIIFILSADNYKSKTIKIKSDEIKNIINSDDKKII